MAAPTSSSTQSPKRNACRLDSTPKKYAWQPTCRAAGAKRRGSACRPSPEALMTGIALPFGVAINAHKGWIHSPAFDLSLLVLSPLSGVAVAFAALHTEWGRAMPLLAVYFVATPHYLSTFTFFLDDGNLAYYRRRWVAFFALPVLCASIAVVVAVTKQAALFQAGLFTWNLYHVALQSAGILGIYRALNGGPASERRLAVAGIVATGAAMALVHVERFPPLHDILSRPGPAMPTVLLAAAVIVALVSLFQLVTGMVRRRAASSEVAFLATSLLLFHPYLWVE